MTDAQTGILVALVKNINDKGLSLGKIQFQKLVFFLKRFGVPFKVRYSIYRYGPYSEEVTSSLNALDSLDILDVSLDDTRLGYNISLDEYAPAVLEHYSEAISEQMEKINFVVDNFAIETARSLEAEATLLFADIVLKEDGSDISDEAVRSAVKGLKPKFTDEELEEKQNKLKSLGFID